MIVRTSSDGSSVHIELINSYPPLLEVTPGITSLASLDEPFYSNMQQSQMGLDTLQVMEHIESIKETQKENKCTHRHTHNHPPHPH